MDAKSPTTRGRRQSLGVYPKKYLPTEAESVTMTTVNTTSTVDTKSIHKALKLMRGTKLERESSIDRMKRLKEASRRRKEARNVLENKQKLYSMEPILNLNSVAALKKQATIIYNEKCIKERNDRYGDLTISTGSSHNKLSVSQDYIQDIVREEQEILDSGINVSAAMALTHKNDRERYKSARQNLAELKKQRRRDAREFYEKQASEKSLREIHMPAEGSDNYT